MNDLQSLGHAAGMYQRSPREIEAAIAVVQAEAAMAANKPIPHTATPALRLNGIAYYPADEIAKAVAWLAVREAEKRAEASADA